jgi:hypothetical protein
MRWSDHVDSLGNTNALALRTYTIAMMRDDEEFRHDQIFHPDRRHNRIHDGRVIWAQYIPALKEAGELNITRQLEAQAAHEARVDALSFIELEAVAKFDPTISKVATNRGWRWQASGSGFNLWAVKSLVQLLSSEEVSVALSASVSAAQPQPHAVGPRWGKAVVAVPRHTTVAELADLVYQALLAAYDNDMAGEACDWWMLEVSLSFKD